MLTLAVRYMATYKKKLLLIILLHVEMYLETKYFLFSHTTDSTLSRHLLFRSLWCFLTSQFCFEFCSLSMHVVHPFKSRSVIEHHGQNSRFPPQS